MSESRKKTESIVETPNTQGVNIPRMKPLDTILEASKKDKDAPVKVDPSKTGPLTAEEKAQRNLLLKREAESKMVDIVFRNHEVQGGNLEFEYLFYKGDERKKYELLDGHQYSLPLGVVRHINNLGIPKYEYKQDKNGRPYCAFSRVQKRFTCEDVNFVGYNQYIDHIDGYKAAI